MNLAHYVSRRFLSKLVISLLGVFLLASNANAACEGSTCTGKITSIRIETSNNEIYIGTESNEMTLTNCVPARGRYLVLKHEQEYSQQLYDLLMKAMLSERNMWIGLDSNCEISAVEMY